MPELPEVETIVRGLSHDLTGSTLTTPRILRPDVLRGVTAQRLVRHLAGARIERVSRRAKHFVLELDSGLRTVVQLRMTGALFVYHRRLRRAEEQYLVFRSAIGGGRTFVFRDVRRLGTIWLLNQSQWETYTAAIGPEPLADDFQPNDFANSMAGTRQAIKKSIMDQRRLAGVGNIYANEALFLAAIDPSTPTDRLDRSQLDALYRTIRQVLAESIEAGGTTVRDYRTGTGELGSYQIALRVYGRDGEPCDRCATRLHTTHTIDGRATTFCWRCQGRHVLSVR